MATTYSPVNAYRETKVKTASQGQIIVMLYDEAIRQLDIANELLPRGPEAYDRVNTAIQKSRDIITELMVSLDLEQGGDFAQRMFSLYSWFNQELLDANFRKDVQPISAVRDMMSEVRDAWAQIAPSSNVQGSASGGLNIAG
jgi:flagellar protein FliS